MIEVKQLSKSYGAHKAIDNLDFTVEKGEIVGFLGPNGAGKSTTMRILAGSLGATSGVAKIGGFDVFAEPKQTKRIVGYLPEVPPLYTDMTVRDFLRFCARIKGAANPKVDVERAIERVALGEVAHRLIEHLSKGYRQRVGIASALVHSPSVLILDEPTSGLDPAQRVEIRSLVRELSQGETTVVLSTHVLSEIEAICDRVIIIHRGHIVARDSIEALAGRTTSIVLKVARPSEALRARLAAIDGVTAVRPGGDSADSGSYFVDASRDLREEVARVAVESGLLELGARRGLEDVFLQLTGQATSGAASGVSA